MNASEILSKSLKHDNIKKNWFSRRGEGARSDTMKLRPKGEKEITS